MNPKMESKKTPETTWSLRSNASSGREALHKRGEYPAFSHVTSLHTLEGIVEDRPTLEASDFAGSLTAAGQHIIDEPLVCTANVRTGAIGPPTGFLNHLGFHSPLRFFERRILVSRHLSKLLPRDTPAGYLFRPWNGGILTQLWPWAA